MSLTTATPKEDQFITENYLTIPVKRIAKILNRSGCFVKGRLKALNLIIPNEIILQRKADSQLKKGNQPYTKGMKQHQYMSAEAIEKTKLTRFKKGDSPHNVKDKNGVTSIRLIGNRQYIFIRISPSKWYPYHQYLYENQYGKLPKEMCLWFKDGNSLNCTLENLEVITRQENIDRNIGREHLSDKYVARMLIGNRTDNELLPLVESDTELLEIKRNQIILKRQIKKHDR